MRHLFFITILVMGGLLILRAYLDPPTTVRRTTTLHGFDNSHESTWSNPDNLKQIKKRYKL